MDRTVKSVPTIKGSDYPTFEGAMNAAMEAAEGADGIAAVGFSLGELPESFWDDEAKNQREEIGEDISHPDFSEQVAAFIDHAQSLPNAANAKAELEELSERLAFLNAWGEERSAKIQNATRDELEASACPVAYQLEIYALDSVSRLLAGLGLEAMKHGDIMRGITAATTVEQLNAIRASMIHNAPKHIKEMKELGFSQIHDILSAGLSDEYRCEVFNETYDAETRIVTLYNRVSRKLDINKEEFPVELY